VRATHQHGKSKDEFQTELDIAIIGNGIRDGPERTKLIGIASSDGRCNTSLIAWLHDAFLMNPITWF
jgi:hypothetical protein